MVGYSGDFGILSLP